MVCGPPGTRMMASPRQRDMLGYVWIAVIVTGWRAGKPRTSMATVASNNGAG